MNWHIFQTISSTFQGPLMSAARTISDNGISAILPAFQAAMVMFIVLTGWRLADGRQRIGGLWPVVARAGIFSLALTEANYDHYITQVFLTDVPDAIGSLVLGSGSVGAAVFDQIWDKGFTAGVAVLKSLSWMDFGMHMLVALYLIVAMISCGLCFLIWMLAQVALALLVAVGPAFLACGAFRISTPFFEKWVSALVGAALLEMMTVALLMLLIGSINPMLATIGAPSGNPYAQMQTLLGALLLFVIAGLMVSQIPGVATAVAGGVNLHVGALHRATYGVAMQKGGQLASAAHRKAIGGLSSQISAIRGSLRSVPASLSKATP